MKKIFVCLVTASLILLCSIGCKAPAEKSHQSAGPQSLATDQKIETKTTIRKQKPRRFTKGRKIETSAPPDWTNPQEMRERLQARARSVGISAYSVGVIPFNEQDCPHNTLVVLDMDDESSDNRNSVDGWIGAITNGIASSGNNHTIFRFCKVDGTQFKSLPPQGLQGMRAYALLKLGNSCPAGSTEFRRYFDNEDAYNENGWANSPDIYPNYMRKNTELQFCLFTVGSDSMTDFPELKDINSHLLQYGVFAHTFPEEPDSGKLHIDDEDDDNRNKYVVPQAVKDVAQRIISDGKNTDIWVARVK